jgi:hypothetical protein
LEKLSVYFFSYFNFQVQTLWFKRLLYFFLLIKSAYWLCYYNLLFGVNSIIFTRPLSTGTIRDLAFTFFNSTNSYVPLYFIISLIILTIISLVFRKVYFALDLFIWLIVVNLNNRIYSSLTGGDNLLNLFLFFNCFLSASFGTPKKWHHHLRILLHNFGILSIITQTCLVYLLSALAKLNNTDWLYGEAIDDVSQIRHFSLFTQFNNHLLFVVLNYLVLVYQLFFPLLIWLEKFKKPFLVAGIVMHLYIAFVMGLVEFGAIMILAYVYFWPVKKPVS